VRIVRALLVGSEAVLALINAYLLVLLGAAALARRGARAVTSREASRATATTADGRLRFAIVIPAHDEQDGIGDTLETLSRLEYPRDRMEVLVVADNCRDRTAERAAQAGATVYERINPSMRGKGAALAWALERLLEERPDLDAVVIVDADCHASPNLLTALERRLRAGAAAVQVDYVVANPGASWSSGLRFAAFALYNNVRPLGKSTLGLSCGLLGTGMAFRRSLLERYPWDAFTVAEDWDYHLRLAEAGERVVFAPEASVSSAMPTSLQQARAQHLRWEGGQWGAARRWTARLILDSLRRRDPVRLHAALEPLVPPQSLLLAGNTGLALLAAGLRSRGAVMLAVSNLSGQLGFVLAGLVLIQAPAEVYRALIMAPLLAVWKVHLYIQLLTGHGPQDWVRTERQARPASIGCEP
jgi:hypothetical protein